MRKWGPERLPNMPTVTQQICDGARIRTQTCRLQILFSLVVLAVPQASQVQLWGSVGSDLSFKDPSCDGPSFDWTLLQGELTHMVWWLIAGGDENSKWGWCCIRCSTDRFVDFGSSNAALGVTFSPVYRRGGSVTGRSCARMLVSLLPGTLRIWGSETTLRSRYP